MPASLPTAAHHGPLVRRRSTLRTGAVTLTRSLDRARDTSFSMTIENDHGSLPRPLIGWPNAWLHRRDGDAGRKKPAPCRWPDQKERDVPNVA